MNRNKSNPPNHSMGRRPLESIDSLHPSSLPPELGSLDMSWDDDPRSVGSIDLLQNDLDLDIDAGERTTAIPAIPMDQLVEATMAEADARELASEPHHDDPHAVDWHDAAPTALSNHKPLQSDPREAAGVPASTYGSTSTQPAPARTRVPTPDRETQPALPLESEPDPSPSSRGALLRSRLAVTEPPQPARSMAGPVGPSSSRPPFARDARLSSPPTLRRSDLDQMRHQMKDRYATGDFSGALQLAEALLEADDGDLEAQRFATSCRDVLTQMLTSRIGSFEQTVEVALSPEELRWLTLDHRAGFFLSLVDGSSTIEELLDISGMARLESLRILSTLLEQRVLRVMPH